MKKFLNDYESPTCNQMQVEVEGVLASSCTFENYAPGVDDSNTTEYSPEWF